MSDNINNLNGLFEAAVAKDKSGEGSEALRLLDTLLEYQPGHRMGLFYRGGIKVRYRRDVEGAAKDWEEAFEGAPAGASTRVRELYPLLVESCLERFIQFTTEDPHNAAYHSGFGRACILFGQPELADRHLRRALDLDSTRGIDGVRLAEVLMRQGKKDEALQVLQKQRGNSPDSLEVQSNLGLFYRNANMFAQALKHLEAAAALNPRHMATRQALGEIYLAQGRMEQAESHFQFLLSAAPSAAVHCGLAECDKQQYRFDEALEKYCQAVQLEPKNFEALSALGALALQMGALDLGISSLKSALAVERGHPEIQGLLAKAALQKGDTKEAISALRLQLQLDPKDGFASYTLASQLRGQGEYQEASQLLRTTLQTRASDAQVWLDLAECYIELRRQPEALEVLREAYQRNPNREDVKAALVLLDPQMVLVEQRSTQLPEVDELVNLGRAHLQGGQQQEAFDSFRKVLAVSPQHPESLAQIGRIYAARNVHEPACEFMLRSYSSDPTQLPLLLELFKMLNQLSGRQAYPLLDQLARCLPQDMKKVAWLDYLWRNQQSPGLGQLLRPLIDADKKTYPPNHPVSQQWIALQLTAQK